MKKYTIIHNFTAVASIEVLAETREEAFEKARQNELDLADYDFELDSAEIGKEEYVPELSKLIEQAEAIIKRADDIILVPWPLITTEVWDGNKMKSERQRMENIYWDEEADEIGFNTDESSGDFLLSELPELEQLEICQLIIKTSKP